MSRLTYQARIKARYWFSRWPLAHLMDRSASTCWADLVTWALDGGADNLREVRGGRSCIEESQTHAHNSCYCGKFTNGCLTRKGQTPGDVS